MTGLLSLAILTSALVLSRYGVRRFGGVAPRGFMARRGVAETVAVILVAFVTFPLGGLLESILNGEVRAMGAFWFVGAAVIAAAGLVAWRLVGRIPQQTAPATDFNAVANDFRPTATSGRKVA